MNKQTNKEEIRKYRYWLINEIKNLEIGRLRDIIKIKDYPQEKRNVRENELTSICYKIIKKIKGKYE